MKKNILALLALLLTSVVCSQDLIITTSSDSISCKIYKVKKEHIYFIYKRDNAYQSTLIDKKKVSDYQYNFFPKRSIPKDSLPGYEKYPKHLFAMSFGVGNDPVDAYPNLDDYRKQLSTGTYLEGNYTYYFTNSIGVGLAISYFSTSASENNVIGNDSQGNQVTTDLSNDISTFFIGPLYAVRYLSKNKRNAFIWNTAIGYISYKDIFMFDSEIKTTGNGFGGYFTLGYNYGINEKLSLGLQIGITSVLSDKFTVQTENETLEVVIPDEERLFGSAHLDFSIGLRYSIID